MPTKNQPKYLAVKRNSEQHARLDQLTWAVWGEIRELNLDSERACKLIKDALLAVLDSPKINTKLPELNRNGVSKNGSRKAGMFGASKNAGVDGAAPSDQNACQ